MKLKVLSLAGIFVLAACSPAPDADQDAAASLSGEAAALHALLLDEADNLVPSDWQSGAPVPETAQAY